MQLGAGQKGKLQYEAENTKKFGGHKGSGTQNNRKFVNFTIHRIFFFQKRSVITRKMISFFYKAVTAHSPEHLLAL